MSKREGNPPPPGREHRPAPPPGPPATGQAPAPAAKAPALKLSGALELPGDDWSVYQRFNAVQAASVPIVKRKSENLAYPFKSIDDVYEQLKALVSHFGLIMLPVVVDLKTEERESDKGKNLIYRVMTIDYHVFGLLGDRFPIPIRVVGEAMDTGERASSKAQSTGHKVGLLQAFMIPAAEGGQPSSDSAAGPARQGNQRTWSHNDRYRYGDKAKGEALTSGSFEYLVKYRGEIAGALEQNKPYATRDHLEQIDREIAKREKAAADQAAADKAAGPAACDGCGAPVENGACTECGLVQ